MSIAAPPGITALAGVWVPASCPSTPSEFECRPTSAEDDQMRRATLALFLRTRRESLQPEDIGIPRRGRRRVKGLRRHEVADAAAVSVTWYTWLEQGRDIQATSQVIEAIARALKLGDSELNYFCRLAGVTPKSIHHSWSRVGESMIALVDSLMPNPAQLMAPGSDLITWNRAYARLFVDPSTLAAEDRNALWMHMTCPEFRERLVDWEAETKLAVSRFRAEAAKNPGDPRFQHTVGRLMAESEYFRNVWGRHEVEGPEGLLTPVRHPDVGIVRVRLVKLRPMHHPDLLVIVHMLEDDESRERIGQLLAV